MDNRASRRIALPPVTKQPAQQQHQTDLLAAAGCILMNQAFPASWAAHAVDVTQKQLQQPADNRLYIVSITVAKQHVTACQHPGNKHRKAFS